MHQTFCISLLTAEPGRHGSEQKRRTIRRQEKEMKPVLQSPYFNLDFSCILSSGDPKMIRLQIPKTTCRKYTVTFQSWQKWKSLFKNSVCVFISVEEMYLIKITMSSILCTVFPLLVTGLSLVQINSTELWLHWTDQHKSLPFLNLSFNFKVICRKLCTSHQQNVFLSPIPTPDSRTGSALPRRREWATTQLAWAGAGWAGPGRGWGNGGCLAWRKGGWGETLPLSTTTWKEVVARWVSVSSPRELVTGREETASTCARGGLDWMWGETSSPKGLSSPGIGCPGKRLSPHPWRYRKDVRTRLRDMA